MLKKFSLQIATFAMSLFAFFAFSQNVSYAASCKDVYPPIAPVLVSAVSGNESVTLTWTQEPQNFTHYLVAYGRNENDIEFGNPNIGGKDTRTYTVGNLTNGVKYYFRVKPVNGCKPGKFSNKLDAIAGGYQKAIGVPNLSLYKTENPTISPTTKPIIRHAQPKVLGAATQTITKPLSITWQLLLIEAIVLVLYFIFTTRIVVLSRALALFIPVATFVVFLVLNKTCQDNFFCKYFLQLDILIFVIVIALSKIFFWKNPQKPQDEGNKK